MWSRLEGQNSIERGGRRRTLYGSKADPLEKTAIFGKRSFFPFGVE